MTQPKGPVLVFGATGQQGGATARALLSAGVPVRAFVRNAEHPRARELAQLGAELAVGSFEDAASLERAMAGCYGVFSIQPSSGQPQYGLSDADELRIGRQLVGLAQQARVQHFVYSSVGGLEPGTGVGHFETKWQIEEHVRASGLPATVVRPTAFMELLLEPHFGLAQRAFTFFLRPNDWIQLIAVQDIGRLVAHIFTERQTYLGQTIELAGDQLTGQQIADAIARTTGSPISYAQFPPSLLEQNSLLKRLVELVESHRAVGNADIPALRRILPDLLTFEAWLTQGAAQTIRQHFAA